MDDNDNNPRGDSPNDGGDANDLGQAPQMDDGDMGNDMGAQDMDN